MTINWQYQSLHTPGGPEVDWVLVQKVERDICLLYHQLAEYSFIMGDLYYDTVYTLPYWEYLDLTGLQQSRRRFIRDGCLVMILAMCWDKVDGSGDYIDDHLSACEASVAKLEPEDDDCVTLHGAVTLALQVVKEGKSESQKLVELSQLVHNTYVRGYFTQRAREFDTDPYFQEGSQEQPT